MKTKYRNSSDWDVFMEMKFEKSDITDLLKGNQFNLCSANFLHRFTTGAIF